VNKKAKERKKKTTKSKNTPPSEKIKKTKKILLEKELLDRSFYPAKCFGDEDDSNTASDV
jgi:hypothetical protein